jgi:hypothetical protein
MATHTEVLPPWPSMGLMGSQSRLTWQCSYRSICLICLMESQSSLTWQWSYRSACLLTMMESQSRPTWLQKHLSHVPHRVTVPSYLDTEALVSSVSWSHNPVWLGKGAPEAPVSCVSWSHSPVWLGYRSICLTCLMEPQSSPTWQCSYRGALYYYK